MTLEQQVTSLELSKKLKELGVKQDSLFWWLEVSPGQWNTHCLSYGKREENIGISAFTVSELGEILPEYFCSAQAGTQEKWVCEKYSHGTIDAEVPRLYADTEANARAKMLIYLIEHKLITL